jgi:hypothetical protein
MSEPILLTIRNRAYVVPGKYPTCYVKLFLRRKCVQFKTFGQSSVIKHVYKTWYHAPTQGSKKLSCGNTVAQQFSVNESPQCQNLRYIDT